MLSPDERAEKIAEVIRGYCLQHTCIKGEDEGLPIVDALTPPNSRDISKGQSELNYLVDSICGEAIAQIREAEKEAMGMRADPDCAEHCRLAKLEGRASMLEEAAKVVEQYFDAMNPDIQLAAIDIIEHIRAIPLENK